MAETSRVESTACDMKWGKLKSPVRDENPGTKRAQAGREPENMWGKHGSLDWISMDATLNQMPSDATHVELAEGGLDRQAEIIALVGKIELEVLDYEYD